MFVADARLKMFERLLREWKDDHWNTLLKASDALEPSTDLEAILTQLLDRDLDLPMDLHPLFWAIASLGVGAQAAGRGIIDFVEEVLEAVVLQSEGLGPETNTGLLRDWLVKVLSTTNPIGLSIKAAALGDESHNVYQQCRVISDIRHVFPEEMDSGPIGTIIVHNLKIGHIGDGLQKSVYIACDRSDLEELQEAIGRALKKESSLRGSISKDIPSIRGN